MIAESTSPQSYGAHFTLCSKSNPPSAYHIRYQSNTTSYQGAQRNVHTSVLKGRVGAVHALSHNFRLVEMDKGDIAVDDIPIGNVSCGCLVERISLYTKGKKTHHARLPGTRVVDRESSVPGSPDSEKLVKYGE
jgi:hypothetical protein